MSASEKPSVAFPAGFLAVLDPYAKALGLSRSAFIVKACNKAMGLPDDWRPNRSPVATMDATQPADPGAPLPVVRFEKLPGAKNAVCVRLADGSQGCGAAQAKHGLDGRCPA